jgi:hypothetical protein
MARLGRYFLPDQPLHVIQGGNNRGALFFAAPRGAAGNAAHGVFR